MEAFQAARKTDPERAAAHDWIAGLLLRKGDAKGALASAREAVRLAPNSAPARANLGAALEAAGDLKGALRELEEAVRLGPKVAAYKQALDRVRKSARP